MKSILTRSLLLSVLLVPLMLTGCGTSEPIEDVDPHAKNLNQILAAKARYALAKGPTPLLNTHDWDGVFGGADGSSLKYDRFGEVDELVFVALPDTFFNLQRQIRKETRAGKETIYYKVTTPVYEGSTPLWVDGRFLSIHDVRPEQPSSANFSAAQTLKNLRQAVGATYTWNGSSAQGVDRLLEFYPPAEALSTRSQDDWILKGFNSTGLLYEASNGKTPLSPKAIGRFGKPVFMDLSKVQGDEGNDDPNVVTRKRTDLLLQTIRPLDIIQMGDRTWIVLDKGEVIESKYRSKFDGRVETALLLDVIYGLLQKATLVKNPFEEVEESQKRFFIRRYIDTGNLLEEQLEEADEGDETSTDNTPSSEDTEAATGEETPSSEEGNSEDENDINLETEEPVDSAAVE